MDKLNSLLILKIKQGKITSLFGFLAGTSMMQFEREILIQKRITILRISGLGHSRKFLKSIRSNQGHHKRLNIQPTHFRLKCSCLETHKSVSFFQGIFAGMALLFTITLNLSSSLSQSLVRVQDHSIRVVALIATFGSFFSTIRAKDKYYYIKLRGTSSEVEERYKCYVLCVIQMLFYTLSYILFNVSHTYSVKFNISGGGYDFLSLLTTIYTALCLIGWVVTNINSKKHEK